MLIASLACSVPSLARQLSLEQLNGALAADLNAGEVCCGLEELSRKVTVAFIVL